MKFFNSHRIAVFLLQLTILWIFASNQTSVLCKKTTPYYASIQNRITNSHLCNGVIYQYNGKNWVITSATCTMNLRPNDITVFYGSKNLNDDGFRNNVTSIYKHPKFDVKLHWYDISLLLLDGSIYNVRRIDLPIKDITINQSHIHGGWKIAHSRINSDSLQIQDEIPISKEQCKQMNPSLSNIREWMICTNNLNRPTYCSYQRLGSILTSSNDTLYGILSSCDSITPIYTNVYELIDWILFYTVGSPI